VTQTARRFQRQSNAAAAVHEIDSWTYRACAELTTFGARLSLYAWLEALAKVPLVERVHELMMRAKGKGSRTLWPSGRVLRVEGYVKSGSVRKTDAGRKVWEPVRIGLSCRSNCHGFVRDLSDDLTRCCCT
jgi:hypothetical protein